MANKKLGVLRGWIRVGIARKNSNYVFDDLTAVGVHDNGEEPEAGGRGQLC